MIAMKVVVRSFGTARPTRPARIERGLVTILGRTGI
jgi:hypothetical protein